MLSQHALGKRKVNKVSESQVEWFQISKGGFRVNTRSRTDCNTLRDEFLLRKMMFSYFFSTTWGEILCLNLKMWCDDRVDTASLQGGHTESEDWKESFPIVAVGDFSFSTSWCSGYCEDAENNSNTPTTSRRQIHKCWKFKNILRYSMANLLFYTVFLCQICLFLWKILYLFGKIW